jgi:lysyl-tRNA synthetase class II
MRDEVSPGQTINRPIKMFKRILLQNSRCRSYSLKSKPRIAPTIDVDEGVTEIRGNGNTLPSDYAQRLSFLQASSDTSSHYPHQRALTTWMPLPSFHSTYPHLHPTQSLPTDTISITGRVSSIRSSGEHLLFVDISEGEDKVQVVLTSDHYIKGVDFGEDVDGVQRGDIVEVHGMPFRTAAGELSVKAIAVNRLTPCLINLPSHKHPLNDIDKAIRNRHLDLLSNPSKLRIFQQRAQVQSTTFYDP